MFTFGGCMNNGNNFKTLEECQKTCRETKCPSIEQFPVSNNFVTNPFRDNNVSSTYERSRDNKLHMTVTQREKKVNNKTRFEYNISINARVKKDTALIQ